MFTIDYKSRLPLYEQLVESIKSRVMSGALAGDDPLPSVRQLSGQLGINPNTVQKAYSVLEQQSIIYTVPGKGNFIRPDTDALRHRQAREAKAELSALAEKMKNLGISLEEAQSLLADIYRKEPLHDHPEEHP